MAVDLVADVVLNGVRAPHDVEPERDVVLEEIAMRDDDPEDTLGDLFLSAMFGDHPVGRPVIGSVESVSGMTRNQLRSFHVRRYTPERMVLAVAGEHRPRPRRPWRAKVFRRLVKGHHPQPPRKGAGRPAGQPQLILVNRDSEQTHLSSSACASPAGTGRTGGCCRCSTWPSWRQRPEFATVPADPGGPGGWPTRCTRRSTPSPTAGRSRSTPDACRSVSTRWSA